VHNQKKLAIVAIVTVIPLSIFALWNSNNFSELPEESDQIIITASFYPLYEFSKQVGQDRVTVSLLVPPGIEPHDWEPSIKDIELMKKSSLIVINGIGFETWVDDVKSISSKRINIVDTSIGINLIENDDVDDDHELEDEHGDEHGTFDPHIWLNPVMAKTQVNNIKNALVKIDPENESYYTINAESYLSKLDSLDQKIRNDLQECKKDFIAFHNAFSYFADEYGLNQHTIVSTSPNAEPTPQTLQKIISLAKEHNIKVIFSEESVNPRVSEVIANEFGGKVLTLSPIEVFENDASYISKMEKNLANLKEALCK
jgi:zinc transport system substrate-binding protein